MNLKEVAELSWNQIFPKGSVESSIPTVAFIRTAYAEFAYQKLLLVWKSKSDEGYYEVDSYLLASVEKDVINNEIDISDLQYFKSLPMEIWLVNIGGINCGCKYVKSSVNLFALLCGDDSMDDAVKLYYPLGKKIIFPNGVHITPLTLIYATMGEDIDGNIEVEESIASLIRTKLNELYLNKIPQEDTTINQNPNN